jgi:hypothetical protein
VTCEGRYGLVFYFHIRFLMVFLGFRLNMPFYLLRSLSKMAKFYQRKIGNPEANLFHHGLIRILIEYQLVQIGDTWDAFVIRNNFLHEPLSSMDDSMQGFQKVLRILGFLLGLLLTGMIKKPFWSFLIFDV